MTEELTEEQRELERISQEVLALAARAAEIRADHPRGKWAGCNILLAVAAQEAVRLAREEGREPSHQNWRDATDYYFRSLAGVTRYQATWRQVGTLEVEVQFAPLRGGEPGTPPGRDNG